MQETFAKQKVHIGMVVVVVVVGEGGGGGDGMAPGTGAPQIFGIMCAVPEAPVTIFSKRVDLLYVLLQ